MAKSTRKTKKHSLMARGGGNATASGVSFQASVAAFLAAQGLAETPVDPRLSLGAAKPIALRFETEAPVDDILVSLDSDGWAFIQSKNRLSNSSSLTSELGKTCDEFARLWEATVSGTGQRGWDRPLIAGIDVMVIAIGPTSSATIKDHLTHALNIFRSGSPETLTNNQKTAFDSFRKLVGAALTARGGAMAAVDPDIILKFVHVIEFDFGGAHRTAAEALLANALEDHSVSAAAFAALEMECERRMADRNGVTISCLRNELARSGVPISAPQDYRKDVDALRVKTQQVAKALREFEQTQVGETNVSISRACTKACVSSAKNGSLVLVGEPGTGKSAIINQTARILHAEGNEVVLLAVDRLQVESIEGLSRALGLSHPLPQVLANWPGKGPGYLIFDALDACRFAKSEALYRNIMEEVFKLEGNRWRVVASIRTFDLMMGQEFARLFRGAPPDTPFIDKRFQSVRHINITEWSNTEFEELLSKIPALRIAVDKGGAKLAELARVPFNTRLLADLLSTGVAPEKFKHLASQVQLLDMYWNNRIRPLGAVAEQCLYNTVSAMIERRRMEASRIAAGAGTGNVLDQLQRAGVLIAVNNDRGVAFSHHILFDYTASRVLIDLNNVSKTKEIFQAKGTGLLLAPALSFAFQQLWETSGRERIHFWEAITEIVGDSSADPVARIVAARAGSDFPSTTGDIDGLLGMMARPQQHEKAFSTFGQLVSSLVVRLEDDNSAPPEPWCLMAAGVAPYVKFAAWPLRTLIHILIDRVNDAGLKDQLGTAARALIGYSLTAEGGDKLMPLAIGFVGKTFGTDPIASRRLVEELLTEERMAEHAHIDMYWLAAEVGRISTVDPELVVEIYDRIFSHKIEENEPTSLGQSRILSLTSNRRQDFEGAQSQLKDSFSTFALEHPLEAADAVVKVSRGYTVSEHSHTESVETITVRTNGNQAKLIDDYSYIWAAEHKEPHADDVHQIVDSFVDMMRETSEDDVVAIAERIIAQNEFAWLWNRLFMVAKERGRALAAAMQPWACQIEFLKSEDTVKPAIDLTASQYKLLPQKERSAFEKQVLEANFPESYRPDETRLRFQRNIFGAIGIDALETSEARRVIEEADKTVLAVANENDVHYYRSSGIKCDDFSILRDKGVDVDAPDNALILSTTSACEKALSNVESASSTDLPIVFELRRLLLNLGLRADDLVVAHGWERIIWAIERITHQKKIVLTLTATQRKAIEETLVTAMSALVEVTNPSIADMLNRARADAAGAMMNMVRAGPETISHLRSSIETFAVDSSPEVRAEIVRKLGYLWMHDQEFFWTLSELIARVDKDARILGYLLSNVRSALKFEPDRIGILAQVLLNRGDIDDSDDLHRLQEGLGTLVSQLWVRYEQTGARDVINEWLRSRSKYKIELGHAVFSLQSKLVIGYDNDEPADAATRGRAHALAFKIIDLTAAGIETFFSLTPEEQTELRNREASEDAHLQEQMSDQFFFAVGALDIRRGQEPKVLKEVDHKKRFLDENRRTFARIGDTAMPRAIYHLLKLLEFLEPADPATVFDLSSHALLKAGRIHGYQFEQLGADQLVKMIGRTIADHRELFEDEARRIALVEVLEVFVDAGWPAARRLLYLLPEALR
ncbi:ATP-binding protein [Hoeflea sp. WL0058]|uniref:ATP-binding protein n=1 Tax=Flavimaribacter sediminis TaxID=2865987 RepID=A0AAE2ZKI1_9HYPH|nr:ATP-binding protein [Flavimaribacter sediminis]MBW8636661.1 ATP-binding protein [Flavimaribacter sediminis]